jgi:hypothetical protein
MGADRIEVRSGTDLDLLAGTGLDLLAGTGLDLRGGASVNVQSSGAATVVAGAGLNLRGSTVTVNGPGCSAAARVGDQIVGSGGGSSGPVTGSIVTGSPTVCVG